MGDLLPKWAALRRHATAVRRQIRANGCTESSPDETSERGDRIPNGRGRCTEEQPDTPGEWCDGCQWRSTARAELAAVKRDIRAVERKMLRATPTQTEDIEK